MDNELKASVIIATYKRGHIIRHCLESLTRQTYRNFETLVVYKPSGDETEKILSVYEKKLNMKLIVQKDGYVTHAMNMSLRKVEGDVVLFIDDDAIAFPEWIEQHIKTYQKGEKVGSVAGLVIPAKFIGDEVRPLEITGEKRLFYKPWKVWLRPLEGMENYFTYFGRNGLVLYSRSLVHANSEAEEFPTLAGSGANMSFLAEAVKGLHFDTETILGNRNEQLIALQIWRRGYKTIGNPKAKVYHLIHRETLSRGRHHRRWYIEWLAEEVLTFFKLKKLGIDVKWTYYITYLPIFLYHTLKKASREPPCVWGIIGILYGVALGVKWTLNGYRRKMILKELENVYFAH